MRTGRCMQGEGGSEGSREEEDDVEKKENRG